MTFLITFLILSLTIATIVAIDVKLGTDLLDGKFISAGINIFLQLLFLTYLISIKL
jgi:hypothetical protein